jgi:hypothetical protein
MNELPIEAVVVLKQLRNSGRSTDDSASQASKEQVLCGLSEAPIDLCHG